MFHGPTGQRHTRIQHLYNIYCKNKPKSDDVVNEHSEIFEKMRITLKEKFAIKDMLISPVQRITKYHLLLKDVLKYTEKIESQVGGEDVEGMKAMLDTMSKIPASANNMMMLGMLMGFHGSITAAGKLLQSRKLVVIQTDDVTKLKEDALKGEEVRDQKRLIFLFEQIVIVARIVVSPYDGSDKGYVFLKQIKTNRMSLIPTMPLAETAAGAEAAEESEAESSGAAEEPTSPSTASAEEWKLENALAIWNEEESESSTNFHVLVFPSEDVKEEWIGSIRGILRMQRDLVSMLQNPQVGRSSSLYLAMKARREDDDVNNARGGHLDLSMVEFENV